MEMKNPFMEITKTFEIGKIAYFAPNRANELVTVTVCLTNKEDEEVRWVLDISAELLNLTRTQAYCSGQCLGIIHDVLREGAKVSKDFNGALFEVLCGLWRKYRRNTGTTAPIPNNDLLKLLDILIPRTARAYGKNADKMTVCTKDKDTILRENEEDYIRHFAIINTDEVVSASVCDYTTNARMNTFMC